MKCIKISKTVIFSIVATSGIFAYNNWRQNIDTPVKQNMVTIKNNAPEKAGETNINAASDENAWNNITAYKYMCTAGMPVVYN
jgi:hypothetical protein